MNIPLRASNGYDIASTPRWHAGRMIVIGDAAHAAAPNAGHGASMAMEEGRLVERRCGVQSRLLRSGVAAHSCEQVACSPCGAVCAFLIDLLNDRQRG
ncbi:FAD-dependent monooxygenase [Amycolatopsis sp. NPDC051102]|uniref:FAD-dependent monooxygenase n=1 Tax=Amycolatopsis sp. NPDC051102 TaxID=3155163 RepID=UPI00341FE13E